MSDFWAAIAQILPVLVLASVLELRAIGPRWYSLDPWVRGLQGALWCIMFVAAAVGEVIAIDFLRDGEAPTWGPAVATWATSGMIGLLIFSPAIDLAFRAATPVIVHIRASQRKLSGRVADIRRQRRDLERKTDKTGRKLTRTRTKLEEVQRFERSAILALSSLRGHLDALPDENLERELKEAELAHAEALVDNVRLELSRARESLRLAEECNSAVADDIAQLKKAELEIGVEHRRIRDALTRHLEGAFARYSPTLLAPIFTPEEVVQERSRERRVRGRRASSAARRIASRRHRRSRQP